MGFTTEDLLKLVEFRMPYGRYKGVRMIHLPEPYVVWFCKQELSDTEINRLMALLYEVKANGLEYLFKPLMTDSNPN